MQRLHDNKWNSARVFFFTDNCGVHAFVWMQVWQHWTEKRVGDIVDGDLCVDGQNEHALRQALRCVHVALLCVQSDRARRPTMGQVIAMLSIDDGKMMELQEPSLPGYVVFRPTAASGPIGYRVSDAGSS